MIDAKRSNALPQNALSSDVQSALKERPSLSIRMRISAGFLVLFALALGVTITAIIMLDRIQDKLLFMEAAGSYNFEIQQARRFEKNYFLYGTNLQDALSHVHQARQILKQERENMVSVVGSEQFQTMVEHIQRYDERLNQLIRLGDNRAASAAADARQIEEELREHGAQMLAVAEDLVAKERHSVNTMLLMSQRIPLVFLVVLLVVVIYLINFITRQMLQPLNRLMEATHRISQGDFTPITPRRRYRDEFSELAIAMNEMMEQLVHRHDLLVRAQKLKAVGTLTAGVAHELNNPINNIMLTACMLLEDYAKLSDQERLEMAQDLLSQSERARKTVRSLLEFARESEIQTEPLRVEELLEETLQLAHNQIKLAKVKIERYYTAGLRPICGDRQQLNQVILNILLNALDAMPDGGTLTIATAPADQEGFIAIDITDTGMGIPADVLPNVFDPFFTSKPQGKGTGLGLSVSLGIIQKHGGEIRVDSQVDQGTKFTILLPTTEASCSLATRGGSGESENGAA